MPVIAWRPDHDPIFRYNVFARHQFHPVKAHNAVLVVDNVPQLYEGCPPKAAIKAKVHEVREPFLLQQCGGFGVLFSVFAHKTEVLLQCLAFALSDTAGQVGVQNRIGVNVIKPAAVGVLVINSHLVGTAPVRNVLFVRVSVCWSSCAVTLSPCLLVALRARVIISDLVGRSNHSRMFVMRFAIIQNLKLNECFQKHPGAGHCWQTVEAQEPQP